MADGKIFAAEFALRRNVKALDKILIEDSDDGVVKYAFPPQIAALSGYAYADSIADLPEDPVNKTIGYVVGDKFYIYVGEGGNAKDGLYQEVQGFVGPQGIPGPKGDKGDAGDGAIDEVYLANYLQQNQYQTASDVNSALAIYATQAYVTQEIDKLLGGASGAYDTLKEIEEVLKGNVDSIGDLFEVLDTKWTQDNTLIAHWNEAYSWGNHATAGYVAKTYVDSNFVTLATAQTITGEKNFTGGFKVNGGVLEYNASLGTWVLNGDLLVTGGVSAFSNIEGFTPSTITDAVLIDNVTIKRNSVGALYVASGSDDGGIDEAYLAEYLTVNNYAKKSDINSALTDYATQSWVTGRGYITGITSAMVTTALGYTPFNNASFTTANIKNTLGISDWALASGVPTIKKEYLTNLDSATSWTAFYSSFQPSNRPNSGGNYLNGITLGSDILGGNYLVQLGLNYFGTPFTRYCVNGVWYDWKQIAFTSDIPTSLKNPYALSWSGYSSGSYDGSSSQSISLPTKLSQLTDDVVSGKYLPLSGGTLTGNITAPTFIGALQGNAATATKLATPHTIWGQSFDGSADISGNIFPINTSGCYYNAHGIFYHTNKQYQSDILRVTSSYNVAIGGTTASEKLHVYGNILATGGITAQNSSDRRLKKNIREFNASKVLMSLGAVWEYEYIDSEVKKNHIYEGTHYGLIYQHVKGTTLDVMCHEREDGMGALNYIHPSFISLIAGATIENISEVESLKKEVKTLRKEVVTLRKQIGA